LTAAGRSAGTIRGRIATINWVARRLTGTPSQDDLVAIMATAGWSRDYRRYVRSTLVGFYDYLVETGVADVNVARKLPTVPESPAAPRPVTDSMWADLLAVAAPRERLMARLAGEAGLRRAEVAAVHRDDLTSDTDGYSLIVRGKGARQRVVPITDDLAAAILAWCAEGYLFPGRDNGHLSPDCVGRVLSELLPIGWSMHKLRHRYASRGYAGTHNLRAVQEALGHASVATTQRYTAVTTSEVRKVSESAA